jgi:hypothetical protein
MVDVISNARYIDCNIQPLRTALCEELFHFVYILPLRKEREIRKIIINIIRNSGNHEC